MASMNLRSLVPVAALVVVIAGCGNPARSGGPAASPASTPRATDIAAPAASATASSAAAASQTATSATAATGQTDTEWGRIWDSVPADFPLFAGATAAEEGATGPASANLAVPGNVAATAAPWMAGQLKDRGYTVDGDATALEDGSFVLDGRRDPGCRVGVTIAPTGGITTMTVMYGAGCPKP
jgi:hypothetical protein